MGLVKALQHRREQAARSAQQFGGLLDARGRHIADLCRPPGCTAGDPSGQLVEPDGVRGHIGLVDRAGSDDLVQQRVHQRHVRAGPRRQVHVGARSRHGAARIDHQQPRRVRSLEPVEHVHPQHRLGLGDVVAEQGDGVRVIDVGVRAGLAVAAEALLERLVRGGRAQPGVAVDVVRADAGARDHRQGVVLLEEQLPGGVEPDRAGARLGEQPLRVGDDPVHGGVPVRLDQPAALAYQGAGQPVRRMVRLPAEQVLRPEPAAVDPVLGAPAHPTIRPSATAMSIASPSECSNDAERTHACTCSGSIPPPRWASTRVGHSPPAG
jgi:hypothetical protein